MLICQEVILKSKPSYIALLVKQHEMLYYKRIAFLLQTQNYIYIYFSIYMSEM